MQHRQTKREMHTEVITNQVLGIIVGWGITFFVLPHLLYLSQLMLANTLTVLFFVASYTRAYLVRRYYDNKKHG